MMGHRGHLLIMSANVSSLKNRRPELINLIDEHKPEVVCLQETLSRSKLTLPNYREVSCVDFNPGVTRGSKLLVRDGLAATEVRDKVQDLGVELIGADIARPRQGSIRVYGAYSRPWTLPTVNAARQSLDKVIAAVSTHPRGIVIGDLNAKLETPIQQANMIGAYLQSQVDDGVVYAHIPTEPTRYGGIGQAPSQLDIALTSTDRVDLVDSIEVLPDIGSDHRPVLVRVPCPRSVPRPTILPRPNLDRADWGGYRDHISSNMDIAPIINPDKISIDRAVDFVESAIQQADQAAIPRKRKPGPGARPLPPDIVRLIKRKRSLRNILQKRGDRSLKPEINRLSKEISRGVADYEYNKQRELWRSANDKNQWGFFKTAQRFLKPTAQDTSYPLKYPSGDLVPNTEAKVAIFKELYDSVYTPPPDDPYYTQNAQEARRVYGEIRGKYGVIKPRPGGDLDKNVTPERIRKSLRRTRNTAPGSDGIYYAHLKQLPDVMVEYLARLYRTAWTCSYFPSKWKDGVTVLLPKPGKEPTSAKNYRPITLLSTTGKTFERVILDELGPYLEAQKILPDTQAGFRQHRSTQDKLFELVQDAKQRFRMGQTTVACFFDIEKAFDKMCHEEFALKLKNAGILDDTVGLLLNYLSDRSIRLRVNGVLSEPVYLKAGTPQGSILSPTLFGIWVSDLPAPSTYARVSQFADDTAIWASGKDALVASNRLQVYTDMVVEWCRKWKILLSSPKTQLIAFSQDRIDSGLAKQRIGNELITGGPSATFLGVVLDRQLSLGMHHAKITLQLRRRVGLLRAITGSQCRPRAPSDIGVQIVRSMIEPLCTYAASVTILRSDAMFREQDKLLTRAYKLALHAPQHVSSAYINSQVGLTSSKGTATRLARDYIFSPKRSESFQQIRDGLHQRELAKRSRKAKHQTPLGILKPTR